MILILLYSVIGVRDNLQMIVDYAMLIEIQQTSPNFKLLRQLGIWPLGIFQTFGAISSQMFALAISVYGKHLSTK